MKFWGSPTEHKKTWTCTIDRLFLMSLPGQTHQEKELKKINILKILINSSTTSQRTIGHAGDIAHLPAQLLQVSPQPTATQHTPSTELGAHPPTWEQPLHPTQVPRCHLSSPSHPFFSLLPAADCDGAAEGKETMQRKLISMARKPEKEHLPGRSCD